MSKQIKVHLVLSSRNNKTGPMPVSTSPKDTCPSNCALYSKGCYANLGPIGMHWNKISNGKMKNLLSWNEFCKAIKNLPTGKLWRYGQAGDLPGKGKRIAWSFLDKLIKANKGKRGFGYSHKPVLEKTINGARNRSAIRLANQNGFTINLSADNIQEADEMVKLNIAPVAVIVPSEYENTESFHSPEGNKVVICPAARKDIKDMNCEKCQLCAIPDRKSVIAFPSHGAQFRYVNEKVRLPIVG